jgi:adenosine deaminase
MGLHRPLDPEHVRRLPKVELHRHLEGAARSATVLELAARHGIVLPVDDPEALYDFRDLEHFIDVYGLVCSVYVTEDDFRRLSYEALTDAAANGVRYIEAFISAFFHLARGVAFHTMVDGLLRGMADAQADSGIVGRLIVDVDKPEGPALAVAIVELAGQCDRELVIGIGGDNLEAGVDHRALQPAYDLAGRLGFHRTIHAGEFDVDTVRAGVRDLGCERIDHGVLVVQDPELLAEVVDRQIGFTVCPSSDIEVSKVWPTLAEHSLPQMLEAGVLLTLNTDDPTMLRYELGDEYATVATTFGLDLHDLEGISLGGVRASWMDDVDKAAYAESFARDFAELRREFGVDEPLVGTGATT